MRKLLKSFYDYLLMPELGFRTILRGQDKLYRFLTKKDDIKIGLNGIPYPTFSVFMPDEKRGTTLSVFRLELSKSLNFKYYAASCVNSDKILGYACITYKHVLSHNLFGVRTEPPKNHVDIVHWPRANEQDLYKAALRAERKLIAQDLSKVSRLETFGG